MTVDMCPLLSKEHDAKPCPGCRLRMSEVWVKKPDEIAEECLSSISQETKATKNTPKQDKILLLELYKLKRLTACEEKPILDVSNQNRALKILGTIEKLPLKMSRADKVQFDLDAGGVLFNLGELEKALKRFTNLSETEGENKRVWNNMGVTMVHMGRTKEALAYYDRALELDPAYGSAWFNKGKALFKLGMKKKALGCFRKATKFSPENKSAWNNLGVTLRHMKKFRESIKCYEKAIKIHSEYPWAWHNKGVALMELKRYKEAMRCFDKALLIDPNYEPAKESKRDVMRRVM